MNASKTVLIMLLDFYLAILSTACMKTTYKSPAAPASVATATTTIPIPVVTATATSTTTTAVLIGHISTAVGVGHEGFSGDGGPATSANLFYPRGVAFDGSGNMYIADTNNYRIRKVATDGVISTYAGSGWGAGAALSGVGGPATSAKIGYLYGVAVDNNGDVFFADIENNRIWKVDSTGNLSIAAGDGTPVPAADGVLATMSGFDHPYGVTFDPNGDLHILDTWNCMIRKVDAWGALTTVVGHLTNGYSGDGGAASSALISSIGGATFDSMGNLYIADGGNGRIRKVDTNGIITTVAGKGTMGYSGDGGPALNAEFNLPSGVAVDGMGNVFVADSGNNVIRRIDTNGVITTVAGNGTMGYSGDGGLATSAQLNEPVNLAVDASGSLYVADYRNNAIRKVTF